VVTYGNVENLTGIERYEGASARRPCPHILDRLVIFWDGTATVCCADINGDLSVGRVDESSIKDLWNNARFSEIRRKHAHLDIESLPICMKCDVTSADHHRLKEEQLARVKKEAAQFGFKF
jgi:radical SAM protein with 4Fe4S-binding SPASM domain